MPDTISTYKSVIVQGNRAGMFRSGVKLKEGDYVIIMAKGEVDVWPARYPEHVYKPERLFLYRIGEGNAQRYYGYNGFKVWSSGHLYLGVVDGEMHPSGEPKNPQRYVDNKGYFVVDIIVWQKEDLTRIADFLEQVSLTGPKNEELKRFAQGYKYRKEYLLAEEKAKKEAEKTQKVTVALKEKRIPENKKRRKKNRPQG
jgi:hypothetical protein